MKLRVCTCFCYNFRWLSKPRMQPKLPELHGEFQEIKIKTFQRKQMPSWWSHWCHLLCHGSCSYCRQSFSQTLATPCSTYLFTNTHFESLIFSFSFYYILLFCIKHIHQFLSLLYEIFIFLYIFTILRHILKCFFFPWRTIESNVFRERKVITFNISVELNLFLNVLKWFKCNYYRKKYLFINYFDVWFIKFKIDFKTF